MTMKEEAIKDLKLFGEHINLSSRSRFYDDVKKFRPKSVLSNTNKYDLEHNLRPFSAGTEPTSPKLNSFLRRTQTDRSDLYYNINSSNKGRPITNISYSNLENGTKIQTNENYAISGKSINLKKYRPITTKTANHYFKNEIIKRTLNVIPERDIHHSTSKLSINLPFNKNENTNNRVSSSSVIEQQYTDSIQKDIPVIQRLKGNIEGFQYEDELKSKDNKDLPENVYFLKSSYEDDLLEDIDHSYDIFSNFDSQLSSVEEEPSQDQDSEKSLDFNLRNTDFYNNNELIDKTITSFLQSSNERNFKINSKYDVIDDKTPKIDPEEEKLENENELKFKNLEYEYKSEIYYRNQLRSPKLRKYITDSNQNSNDNMQFNSKYPFNVPVSAPDDNDVTKQTIYEHKQNDKYQESSLVDKKYLPEIDKSNLKTDDIAYKYIDKFYIEKQNVESMQTKKKLFETIEISSQIKNQRDEGDINKIVSTEKLSMEIKEKEDNIQVCNNNDKKENSTYFKYFEESETKLYTSETIEGHKQEISSVNNFHDLNSQDLRNKSDDIKSNMNFKSVFHSKNLGDFSTLTSDDGLEELMILKKNKTSSRNLLTRVKNWHYNLKRVTSESSINFNENVNINLKNKSEKYRTIKLNKKSKKKEPSVEIKNKNIKEVKFKKGFSKRKDYVLKKYPDNFVNHQKSNKHLIKLKSHKITLTKNKTRINHTVYFDNDASWIGTRINTPLVEVSSYDNTERNKFTNEERCNDREKTSHNTVYFENDILSANKLPKKLSIETNNSFLINSHNTTIINGNKPNEILITNNPEIANNLDESIVQNVTESNKIEENKDFFKKFEDYIIGDISNANILKDYSIIKDICSTLRDTTVDTDKNIAILYKDFANYLEKVEESANKEMLLLSYNQPLFAAKVEELMDLNKAELAHKVVIGVLAAGRASAVASIVRDALTEAAKALITRLKAAKITTKQEDTIITAQTAQTNSRQKKIIEQLINEKKELTQRIEQLTGSATEDEARRGRAAKAAVERLQLELRNQRRRLNAAHKRDKQAWSKNHSQKIKDMTVKELENEFKENENKYNALLAKTQQDNELTMAEMKDKYMKEIKLKDNAVRQLEDKLNKERLLAIERLEQKRIEWEASMANAIERAAQETREANRRAEETIKNARNQTDLWKIEQEAEFTKQRKLLKKEIDDKKKLLQDKKKEIKLNKE